MELQITKRKYRACLLRDQDNILYMELCHPTEGRYLTLPVGILIESRQEDEEKGPCAQNYLFSRWCREDDDSVKFEILPDDGHWSAVILTMTFEEDAIVMAVTATAFSDRAVISTELFRKGKYGMYLKGCFRKFTPAPRGNAGVNRAFYSAVCNCTADEYFAPPPLNFSIGNRFGWISFGLLDLPQSLAYNMTGALGIQIERPEGQLTTKSGEVYAPPRLMLTFPENEWEGLLVFRQKLLEKGIIAESMPQKEQYPLWWQRPMVVTYGDQTEQLQYNPGANDDWGAPNYNQQWLTQWLETAERKLGNTEFTVVVDAFWQHRFSAEPKPDRERFPDLRGFIDTCHARGHKVLLWTAPTLDSIGNDFTPLSQEMGVLSPYGISWLENTVKVLDLTADCAEEYLEKICRGFFGNGEGELDCDGLKMDFLTCLFPLEAGKMAHPEKGIGIRYLYRFFDMFNRIARKIKPDVLLNGSTCDPRFEEVLFMNRLHDTHVYEERELRARTSVLAAPGIIVDSDGCVMLSTWVKETYLNAVMYSTPALYYVEQFKDGLGLPDEDMLALGRLLQLSERKPWGTVETDGNDWRLVRDGKVVGATFGGDTLMLRDREEPVLHLFSWQTGEQMLPLFGMQSKQAENGMLTWNFEAGIHYQIPLSE